MGWRSTIADKVATPVARRSHLSEDDVRAAVGALFLVLTLSYVVGGWSGGSPGRADTVAGTTAGTAADDVVVRR